jgi:Flp pilus assembly protein TadG
LLEFTVVFPLLLVITFGAVQYGMLLITYSGMLNAARETARTWSVGGLASAAAAKIDLEGRRTDATRWVTATDWKVSTSISGDELTVAVAVPSGPASVIDLPFLPMPTEITATVVMRQE